MTGKDLVPSSSGVGKDVAKNEDKYVNNLKSPSNFIDAEFTEVKDESQTSSEGDRKVEKTGKILKSPLSIIFKKVAAGAVTFGAIALTAPYLDDFLYDKIENPNGLKTYCVTDNNAPFKNAPDAGAKTIVELPINTRILFETVASAGWSKTRLMPNNSDSRPVAYVESAKIKPLVNGRCPS